MWSQFNPRVVQSRIRFICLKIFKFKVIVLSELELIFLTKPPVELFDHHSVNPLVNLLVVSTSDKARVTWIGFKQKICKLFDANPSNKTLILNLFFCSSQAYQYCFSKL